MWAPDYAALISLPRLTERVEALPASIERLGFPVTIVEAVDAQDITAKPGWRSSTEAFANALSHLKALMTVPRNADTVLIMEDDAYIPGDFQERMQDFMSSVPENWDALMLGGEHLVLPNLYINNVARCSYTIRTHGYLLHARELASVIQLIERSEEHWDLNLARYLAWHKTYAPSPFIIGTKGFESSIPDSRPLPEITDDLIPTTSR